MPRTWCRSAPSGGTGLTATSTGPRRRAALLRCTARSSRSDELLRDRSGAAQGLGLAVGGVTIRRVLVGHRGPLRVDEQVRAVPQEVQAGVAGEPGEFGDLLGAGPHPLRHVLGQLRRDLADVAFGAHTLEMSS